MNPWVLLLGQVLFVVLLPCPGCGNPSHLPDEALP